MTLTLTARPPRAALDLAGMIRAAWEEGVQTRADTADLEALWRASNASCDAAFVEENGRG